MKKYGLIGFPLAHSFSKQYFSAKFENENIKNTCYELIPLQDISLFQEIIKNEVYSGYNVTIPYKQSIIKYLDFLDDTAKEINAVNTIKVFNNRLTGYNTDVYGFEKSLKPLLKPWHKSALILGTGGGSKAVEYVLKKLNINLLFVSRNPVNKYQIKYSDINEQIINSHHLIINCTPVGMYPHIDNAPLIPYKLLTNKHLLFDLVYNPEITMFLKSGKENGAETINGLKMLHLQAEKSWEIWNS